MSQGFLSLARPRICYFGGGGSTNTVQQATPWSGQQPYLSDIYGQAQAGDTSAVPQYYPGNTYAPLTGQQQGIMSQAIGYGTGGGDSGLNAANANVTSTLSPSYTSDTSGAMGQGQGVLSNELSSDYLNPWNSPAFGTVVNNTLASVIPQTSASFINGGRSDSGLAQAAETQAATNAVGNLAQSQYNTNQGIQNSAAAQASNNYLTQQGNQVKAAALAPGIDQAQASDLGLASNAAAAGQQNNQNQLNANIAAWNYNQMLPWNQLGLYENAVTGAGSPGGTTTTSQPYYSNTMSNLLSAGVGTAGVLGATGAFGSSGWLVPAIASVFSDRRLKTDIERVGVSDSGFPLYMFRYKGEGPMARHIGVMAQDVEPFRPDAVTDTPFGKMVNYSKALAA